MGLISGILLADNVRKRLMKKGQFAGCEPPKGPDEPPKGPSKEPEKPAGYEPHKFSPEDEALIKEFRTAPLKSHPKTAEFFHEYRSSFNHFFKTHPQADWERLAAFFFRHSKYSEEFNEAGIAAFSHNLAEMVNVHHETAALPYSIHSNSIDYACTRSASLPVGSPERNAMELAMRHAPLFADTFVSSKKAMLNKLRSNPAYLKK